MRKLATIAVLGALLAAHAASAADLQIPRPRG
jgi:hypothetical protein